MPDPNIPDEFDVYTLVMLRRPQVAPALSDEVLDQLQERHLAYRAELRRSGAIVVNGPFDEQSDPSFRGMAIFSCSPAEAARLTEGDPSVAAGRLTYEVMHWWVGAGSLAFPLAQDPVGLRREMPEG